MADEVIRISNVAMLCKIETSEGVDAGPVAADAFPFETEGYSYNLPFTSEASGEATGTMVAGAPLIQGQPANLSIRVRLKGANAGYTSSVKPPHHALLSICGMRGLFTAAIAAAALTGGTTTSATLGTGFSATPQAYVGMPLLLSGASAGAIALVTAYSAGKVATLTDLFGSALDNTSSAAIPANWTYAGTSPRDVSERATDHPSGTIYIYEDGTLLKFTGCRGVIEEFSAASAKPGFVTFKLTGIFGGTTDAAIPSGIAIPAHLAPTLVKGVNGVSDAFTINRGKLPISSFSYKATGEVESPDDPNTNYGFGPGIIQGRSPMISCDPLKTLVATRDTLAQIGNGDQFPGVVRFKGVAGNRIAITFPLLQMTDNQPGLRNKNRAEQLGYRCLDSGRDAQGRNTDAVICFY